MIYEHNLVVYRPLLPDSEAELKRLQDEYASIKSFKPAGDLHLTVFRGHTKKRLRSKLERIVHSAPQISAEPYDAEVGAVEMNRLTQVTRMAIRLALNVELDDAYYTELEEFDRIAKRTDSTMWARRFTQPHVTIGYLDVADGLSTVPDAAEAFVGRTLHFAPSTSNVGDVRVRIPVVKAPTVSTPMTVEASVRTVQPGTIPAGFLASLRPQNPET